MANPKPTIAELWKRRTGKKPVGLVFRVDRK